MQRPLLAVAAAAALALSGCGDDAAGGAGAGSTAAATPTAGAEPGQASSVAGGTGDTTDVMARNEEVRRVCVEALGDQVPGAEPAGRSTLRAASTEGGRLFTVTGLSEVDGAPRAYTCSISVTGEEMTVDEVLVEGQ